MGVGNGIFRSGIGSGFEDPGGTPPPRIRRSTPPGPPHDNFVIQLNIINSTMLISQSDGN